ncbi:MAG: DUF2281 domain-containing protein [Thermoanaerobaculia bacterium]|nr:DUF2281 domain-containing protein [Thermoanaerobaculia bacterium]
MVAPQLKNDILDRLDRLPPDLQQRVVDFADALVASEPRGVPGARLLRFAGTIDPQSLQEMEQAIKEDCEQIDPDAW